MHHYSIEKRCHFCVHGMVHFIFKVSRDTEVWQAHENIIEKKHQILVESAKLTGIQLEYTVLKFQG